MCGRPTSCCRIAFWHRLLINSTNWNTYFLSLNQSIKVTEGHHLKFMEEEIIPFQVARGMVIVGSFVGQEEEDLYVWIRRFESEEERKRQYDAVYESDHWKNVIAP